jgi:Sec-independent protein translocase protein TatA
VTVNPEIEEEKHFPFSICDLIFVIVRGDPDKIPNVRRANSGAMTNIKSQMENGKWKTDLNAF